ncbi:MAG: hypothetical protein AAFW46_03890 [Pseudomonadota bacterium]
MGQRIFAAAAAGTCQYPAFGRSGRIAAHHDFAEALRSAGTFDPNGPYGEPLREALSQGDVLLSSEVFPHRPAIYHSLAEFAGADGHKVQLIFVVRDPVNRINSMYTQNVKAFRFSGTLEQFVFERKLDVRLELRKYCKKAEKSGVSVSLAPFGPSMEGTYRRIAERVGLGAPSADADLGVVNQSLSPAATRLTLEHGQAIDVRGRYRALTAADAQFGMKGYFGFNDALIARTLDLLRDEYQDVHYDEALVGEVEPWRWPESYKPENSTVSDEDYAAYRDFVFSQLEAANPGWRRPS